MMRPQIVRADTIDLQDHSSPSAQDHSHAHSQPNFHILAPHQAETLRGLAVESAEENSKSPRISWTSGADTDSLQASAQNMTTVVASDLQQQDQQQDALAVAQNGGHASDDAELDEVDDGLDDDMMDKISSSPSIEDEDIDFGFVYALHTFVATVEGQANATKGDTMVLLDDSNSYWWLVRVVKDSSIGYLPAEHIETPTERLARLNKHRNIDLSAAMLGDQAEKPKNPIKSAIRRRKTKTVTFTDPTIHAYSDYDYSSEEEDLDNEFMLQQKQTQSQEQQQRYDSDTDEGIEKESANVEPLNPRSQATVLLDLANDDDIATTTDQFDSQSEVTRISDDGLDDKLEPSRSRNGTVRNTDSFFKDETVETKKITLTPNLLRDNNEPRASTDTKEMRPQLSLDRTDKEGERKDEKKKKEKDKRPGVIRSLFSRGKDKKRATDEDGDSVGKQSLDTVRDSQEKTSEEFTQVDESPNERSNAAQRHASKLQKQQPRGDISPTRRLTTQNEEQSTSLEASTRAFGISVTDDSSVEGVSEEPIPVMQQAQPDAKLSGVRTVPSEPAHGSIHNISDERKPPSPLLPGTYPDSYISSASTAMAVDNELGERAPERERLSESPVQVSPVYANNSAALLGDSPSQEAHYSPNSSPSPELVDVEHDGHRNQDLITTSTLTPTMLTWDDASLRAFFDSGSDIRDLLSVVYDKTDVPAAGPDHPVIGSLFKAQNAKLAEITNQLDNMLGDWLARKQRTRDTL